jgi:hypothetical protein
VDDRLKLWTTVGSAGTVDVADQEKVIFYNSVVQLGTGYSGGRVGNAPGSLGSEAGVAARIVKPFLVSAVVRYNVTAVDGVFQTAPDQLTLRLRYRDGQGWLVARLIQLNLELGIENVIGLFDTRGVNHLGDPLGGNNNFVVDYVTPNNLGGTADFTTDVYYIELTLSAMESVSSIPLQYPPAVSAIQVYRFEPGD